MLSSIPSYGHLLPPLHPQVGILESLHKFREGPLAALDVHVPIGKPELLLKLIHVGVAG